MKPDDPPFDDDTLDMAALDALLGDPSILGDPGLWSEPDPADADAIVALIAADWSETERRWTLTVEEGGARRQMTAQFLWMCQGYYDHEAGYMPDFPGRERFQGPVVHPQKWPADLVEEGKRFAVIGSGATAATGR